MRVLQFTDAHRVLGTVHARSQFIAILTLFILSGGQEDDSEHEGRQRYHRSEETS